MGGGSLPTLPRLTASDWQAGDGGDRQREAEDSGVFRRGSREPVCLERKEPFSWNFKWGVSAFPALALGDSLASGNPEPRGPVSAGPGGCNTGDRGWERGIRRKSGFVIPTGKRSSQPGFGCWTRRSRGPGGTCGSGPRWPPREGGVERKTRTGSVSRPGRTEGGGLSEGVTGWRSEWSPSPAPTREQTGGVPSTRSTQDNDRRFPRVGLGSRNFVWGAGLGSCRKAGEGRGRGAEREAPPTSPGQTRGGRG